MKISSKIGVKEREATDKILEFEKRFADFYRAKVATAKELRACANSTNMGNVLKLISTAQAEGKIIKEGTTEEDEFYCWSTADVKYYTDMMEDLKNDVGHCEHDIG